jgi:hypothetical protein
LASELNALLHPHKCTNYNLRAARKDNEHGIKSKRAKSW